MHQDGNQVILPVEETKVDYKPLIEALCNWQAIFELALDEAALHLTPEQFPFEELNASLTEMCDLLREVLTQNNIPYTSQQ